MAELSEEEMRKALFGLSKQDQSEPSVTTSPCASQPEIELQSRPPSPPASKPLSTKLRVTLHVTREFEGEVEVLVFDANTLSTLTAEQEAKAEAKKQKFRYFDVISVLPIEF
ncbi:hypothetical protein RYA95_23890 [Pseudomonas syringae pv. actinidiae]|uniref:hypothetical protein n=1 Tax=Pseudomonas TaxID=286 RepID=UPI00046B6D7E|nr:MULTISPECIES: hypothetical protein [Pseudomonas]AYL81089.1 hypothetical protein CN228_15035 [Pseudomonas syringae pv. actinidiae str. Shaanxi_M228]MBL3607147.1 hypothetical protein [Pseudomonas syringae pv. actinidiae]MDU8616094.1 hypothetical protein [Pseudomonas syringae pv. actinidiae]OSN79069.1 hypothetical protein BV352_04952 [Pseudomonas syringae pv. actinidiae]OSR66391.1 hypothetical protein BV327_05065 [Pseudomonas syringae pv. actinidiae]